MNINVTSRKFRSWNNWELVEREAQDDYNWIEIWVHEKEFFTDLDDHNVEIRKRSTKVLLKCVRRSEDAFLLRLWSGAKWEDVFACISQGIQEADQRRLLDLATKMVLP